MSTLLCLALVADFAQNPPKSSRFAPIPTATNTRIRCDHLPILHTLNTLTHIATMDNALPPTWAELETSAVAQGYTALHIAAANGNVADADALVCDAHVEVDRRAANGYTALHCAAHYGHTEICRLLLQNGANSNAATPNGVTPLHLAAGAGHTTVVVMLIEFSAHVNAVAHGPAPSLPAMPPPPRLTGHG